MLDDVSKQKLQEKINSYDNQINDCESKINEHSIQVFELKTKKAELVARKEENINLLKMFGGDTSESYPKQSQGSDKDSEKLGRKYLVLKVFKEDETLSSKEIKKRLKDIGIEASSTTINQWLSQLKKECILESAGHGSYRRLR